MNINYYKEYAFLERHHWWFRVRGKIISKLISNSFETIENKQLNILNIGAATGKTSELLSKFGKVISLEYDKDCCDYAEQQFNLDIIHGSILDLPFKEEEFDLVCAFDVIEHVKDDRLGVQEMRRVCKRDGLIVLTVPAYMFLWSHHDEVNHHYRRYTLKNLKELVKKEDLIPVRATFYNTLLFLPIALFRLLSKMIPEKLIRKGAGSDATLHNSNSLISRILYRIFS
ncbi:MAG: class I SAM-dependent methyltransferase, partial [Daejeonella sp.]|nr:class I SAM-dependent methyltransferase [Daejeonella sp.]